MFEKIANFITHAGTIYAFIAAIMGAVFVGYTQWIGVTKAIAENTKQIEIAQILILKPMVRQFENDPCHVSDSEWDDYIINWSTLYKLRKKHEDIVAAAAGTPIKRVEKNEEPPKCKE